MFLPSLWSHLLLLSCRLSLLAPSAFLLSPLPFLLLNLKNAKRLLGGVVDRLGLGGYALL